MAKRTIGGFKMSTCKLNDQEQELLSTMWDSEHFAPASVNAKCMSNSEQAEPISHDDAAEWKTVEVPGGLQPAGSTASKPMWLKRICLQRAHFM
eukprot:11293020-Karenia_brevis.AAC.1